MRRLSTHWDRSPAKHELSYSLRVTEERLVFSVSYPEQVSGHPDAKTGEFTPELWKWDVGEFFISGQKGKYLEVNFSPDGAWWAQGFTGVREADSEFDHGSLAVTANKESWSGSIGALEKYLGPIYTWKGNVCAILGSPDQRFLSLVDLSGEEADFHQPTRFLSFTEVTT